MEWPIVLLVVGLVVVVAFVLVAVRGSFKGDDAFYGESGTVGGVGGSTDQDGGGGEAGGGDAGEDGGGAGGDGGGAGGDAGDGGGAER
jgi:hypothetical protein